MQPYIGHWSQVYFLLLQIPRLLYLQTYIDICPFYFLLLQIPRLFFKHPYILDWSQVYYCIASDMEAHNYMFFSVQTSFFCILSLFGSWNFHVLEVLLFQRIGCCIMRTFLELSCGHVNLCSIFFPDVKAIWIFRYIVSAKIDFLWVHTERQYFTALFLWTAFQVSFFAHFFGYFFSILAFFGTF
jgi:hypothetical protein